MIETASQFLDRKEGKEFRRRWIQRFLDQGFSTEKAIRLTAQLDLARRQRRDKERADMTIGQKAQEMNGAPPEQWKRKLSANDPAFERLAERLVAFSTMSSEMAHRMAGQTAREADAKKEG